MFSSRFASCASRARLCSAASHTRLVSPGSFNRLLERSRLYIGLLLLALACAVCAYASPAVVGPSDVQQILGTTKVGESSSADVDLKFLASGTPSLVEALTSGSPDLDFKIGDQGTCTSTAFIQGQSCTLSVKFSPLYPGRRDGAVRLRAADGTLLAQSLVVAQARGALPVLQPGRVTTVAGNYGWTYIKDGVLGVEATIFTPKAAVVDGAGNLFISDTGNSRIRRVDVKTGLIATYAGNGTPSFSGDGGLAIDATISSPAGLALDGGGNLYFSDYQNSVVRRVDAVSGVITTVAGTPLRPGYNGDGTPATSAQLKLPESLAFDANGNLLIADSGNNVIRSVDAKTGVISTIAGTGAPTYNGDGMLATDTALNAPTGVAVAADGSILIGDTANNRIRRIGLNGKVLTIAGAGKQSFAGDDGPAIAALLNGPTNVATDPAGNVYFTDSGSNRLREIDTVTKNIRTISGNDSEAYTGDDGPANLATYYGPNGLFLAQNGDLYLTDMFHMRVRRISATALPLTYPVMRVSKVSSPKPVGLVNNGNDVLALSKPTLQQAALDNATTTCASSVTSLAPALRCNFGVEFAPTSVGNPITGTLTVVSDAISTAPVVTLSGEVLSVNPTSIVVDVLAPSTNPSMLGDTVIFQGRVASDDKGRTGTVTFNVDSSVACAEVPLAADGTATCSVAGLDVGLHNILASYSGDPQNASAISDVYRHVVKQRTDLVLTSSDPKAIVTKPVTFTLTATATTGVPTGSITFQDGPMTLGTAVLDANGTARFTTSTLALGTHGITAHYEGDATNASGTSQAVSQVIAQGATSTSVSTSSASIPVGTAVTLSAAVSSLDNLPLSGSVAFHSGNTTLGTAPLQADGTATLALANLGSGTYSIVATYSGDTNNATSSSLPLTQLSTKLPTITTLTTDAATLSAGNTLRLSAQAVLAPGAQAFGSLSGTITFADNGSVLASVPVSGDGSATFAAAGLSVGNHTLTATYNGDANYATSSATHTQSVVQTASTIVVTPGTSSVLAGKEARFVANVSSPTGVPTGTVTFQDAGVTVGSAPLAKGVAVFSISTLGVGLHTLTATYVGDANYSQANSDPVTLQISLAHPSLALTGPASVVTITNAASFSAALSTEGVTPTGTLTLRDGATVIGTQKVTATGTFSFNVSTLSVGTHNIVATYSGDANNDAATSSTVTTQVDKAVTASALVTSLTPSILGKDVTFTATVTSAIPGVSGTVDLLENGQVFASAPLQNGIATFTLNTLSFGMHTLIGRYSGDAQHATSLASPLQQAVQQGASVVVTSNANPITSGQTLTLTAAVPGVAGLVPTGTVIFSDGATVLGTITLGRNAQATLQIATLSVGSHPIQAAYSGDTNFGNAIGSLTQVVKAATTQISLSVSANPATYGNVVDLTARVQSDGSIATGSIAFVEAGKVLGTATLDGSGVAVLHTGSLTPGAHAVVASYTGDGKASPSTSATLGFLVKQPTSLTVAPDANPALTLSRIAFTATLQNSKALAATGSVTFFESGKVIGTSALDANGIAVLNSPPLPAGTHSITATYAGDDANYPATAPVLSESVRLRETRTTVTASATSLNDAQQVTIIAVVQSPTPNATIPTGTITFYSGTSAIGTATLSSGGAATFTTRLQSQQTGSYSAAYAGDANYASSASETTTFESSLSSQFNLIVSNTDVKLARAQHTTVTITAASLKGFSDDLKLGCVGLPYAATCTFTTLQGAVNTGMKLAANGSGTMQLTIDTGDPLGGGRETTATLQSSHKALLCVLPAAVLLCGLRRGRRSIPALLVLLACFLGIGLSGCGGLQVNSTPAGTYTFQVTAVGQNSGVSESRTVTLTVGQ